MKKIIRLTEGDLHKIIKESVSTILNEIDDGMEDSSPIDKMTKKSKKNMRWNRRKLAKGVFDLNLLNGGEAYAKKKAGSDTEFYQMMLDRLAQVMKNYEETGEKPKAYKPTYFNINTWEDYHPYGEFFDPDMGWH
jgi:hypothetical protein